MPYRLAAFADEISPDIQVQMDRLLDNNIRLCALRGANSRGVLELEDFQIPLLKAQYFSRGVRFSCLASPIGKRPLAEPFAPEFERFRLACRRAKALETRVVRIFSFFPAKDEDPARARDEVVRRLRALAAHAADEGLNLLLENVRGVYGATAERTREVLSAVQARNLMVAFDFANFVLAGDDPRAAWVALKPWVKDFHVRDVSADGFARPAGQGDGRLREVLGEALSGNWSGLLTLEPHLEKTPGFAELDGERRFQAAAQALNELLADIGSPRQHGDAEALRGPAGRNGRG